MKRLTRIETIKVRGEEIAVCNYESDDCNDQCRYGICRWQEKANMLLKEYEDTGLTTEQIRELKERDVAREAIITGYNRAIGCKAGECPKCGAMTRDYLTFCSECGQRIKWEDRT